MSITLFNSINASMDDESQGLFALIDSNASEGLQASFLKEFPRATKAFLYDGLPDEKQEISPLLIKVEPTDKALFAWLEEKSKSVSFVSFLWSNATLSELSKHLIGLLDQTLPDGQVVLFRFFDPRIAEALIPELETAQQLTFFGPITQWGYWNRCGQWNAHQRVAPVSPTHTSGELHLTDKQIAHLSEKGRPDAIHARINEYDGALLASLNRCDIYKNIRQQIELAQEKFRLTSDEDLGLYCIFALQFKNGWQMLNPMKEALQKAALKKSSFTQAIEDAPDSAWHTLQEKHPEIVKETP